MYSCIFYWCHKLTSVGCKVWTTPNGSAGWTKLLPKTLQNHAKPCKGMQ